MQRTLDGLRYITEICENNYHGYRFLCQNGVISYGTPFFMDNSKLLEAIAAYEKQAADASRMAAELRKVLDSQGGRIKIHPRKSIADVASLINGLQPNSALSVAIQVLANNVEPMHMIDLVAAMEKRAGKPFDRASVESVLSTAVKANKHGLMRPQPAVYGIERT